MSRIFTDIAPYATSCRQALRGGGQNPVRLQKPVSNTICHCAQTQLAAQRDAAVAVEREAAANKAGKLLRALDAHDKPLLMIECGSEGTWRIVFANTPAGDRAGVFFSTQPCLSFMRTASNRCSHNTALQPDLDIAVCLPSGRHRDIGGKAA